MTLPSMLLMLLGRLGLRDRDGVTVDRRVVRWGSVAAFAGVGSMLIHPEKVMNHEAGVGISALDWPARERRSTISSSCGGPTGSGRRAAR